MTISLRAAAVLAVGFLALHLPYLPQTLEDLDSINFALGLRHFDVAQHQPHPPGYPVFVAVARGVNLFLGSEVRSLGLVSIVSGAIAIVLMLVVFRRWTDGAAPPWVPMGATVVASTSPLFWTTAARPLSDMAGLAAALGVQAAALWARSDAALGLAGLLAGVAVGIRSQVVWLTVPTLAVAIIARPGSPARVRAAVYVAAGLCVGGLAWGLPLIAVTGGPAAYLRALATQGTEDFTGVSMLATHPSPRQLASALYFAWVAPWASWTLAAVALGAAMVGAWQVVASGERRRLLLPLAGFGPYAVFDILFQEAATSRYALPLVLPVAYYAARGVAALPQRVASLSLVALAAGSLLVGGPALMAYGTAAAPAFRLLADMAGSPDERPVLAMHRRQALDMRRPIIWNRAQLPAFDAQLPAPPKREWLEVVKYWSEGGRRPVWFIADPPRSDLQLIEPRALEKMGAYRWTVEPAEQLLGGVRPNVMDWYRIEPPGWFLAEGWALTPETAGVARESGRGPGRAPIAGWIRRRPGPVTLMLGGRNLQAAGDSAIPLAASIDGRQVLRKIVPPGFFLEIVQLEAGVLEGPGDYARIEVAAGDDLVAVEQFDVRDSGQLVYGYGEGWLELEYNPSTGRLWRWTTERATIRLRSSPGRLGLTLRGEFETSARTAHVTVRAGDRVISEHEVPKSFVLSTVIPADVVTRDAETAVTIETDQWYVPAETNWRPSADRRHLGLRVFDCELQPIE